MTAMSLVTVMSHPQAVASALLLVVAVYVSLCLDQQKT